MPRRSKKAAGVRAAWVCRSAFLLVLVGVRVAAATPPAALLADAAKSADWAAVRTLLAAGTDVDATPGGRLHRPALGELLGQRRDRGPADSCGDRSQRDE